MNRHTIALAGAATAVLVGAAAMATAAGDAPTRSRRAATSGTASSGSSSTRRPARATRCASRGTCRARAGPAGIPGPAGAGGPSRPEGRSRRGARIGRRARRHGVQDVRRCDRARRGRRDRDRPDHAHLRVGTPPPPPPGGSARLVINEVDYDQVGADTGGFVEIANTGTAAASLDGIALVLVNGGDGAEYGRKALTGTLAAGAKLVVDVDPQNGAPDGVALVDTGDGRAPRRAQLRGRDHRGHDRHEGLRPRRGHGAPGRRRGLEHASTGSLARIPDGTDADNAAADWAFTTTPTPGAANVKTPVRRRAGVAPWVSRTVGETPRGAPSASPSAACSRAPPGRAPSTSCAPRTRRACRACARGARAHPAASGSSPSARRASVPSASAAWTAQPGSRSWAQSENLQCANSSVTSSNASSMPSSATQSCTSRMPGVSITSAAARQLDQLPARRRVPAGAVVADLLRREQLLARERVDERRLADARRAEQHGREARAEQVGHLVETLAGDARDRDAPARRRRSSRPRPRRPPGAGWRSDFVSTITGRAPLSQARIR